jgi:hypothetical protein
MNMNETITLQDTKAIRSHFIDRVKPFFLLLNVDYTKLSKLKIKNRNPNNINN